MAPNGINGSTAHSQTVDHVFSYPLVKEFASTYESTSLGALTINAYKQLYALFVQPLTPYLQTPYDTVSPYLQQVDSLGDSSLDTIDTHFPAIKSADFGTLKATAGDVLHFPFKLAGEGRDYVLSTYGDEHSKMQGPDGLVKSGKSVVSTELRIASDALHAVADYLGPKKDELQKDLAKLKKSGQSKADQAAQKAEQTKDQVKDKVNKQQ